jgi:phospholipase/carboxylesterase
MEITSLEVTGPHAGQPVLLSGEPLASARAAFVLLHGRGADAADILSLGEEWARPGVALFAPQAADWTWYPQRFTAPFAQNEPWLTSALDVVGASLAKITAAGVPLDHIILLGFSQGACLALEYAARHTQRYGGIVGLSGGLIGPDDAPRDYPGSFAGTPAFLGCSDVDPHIPAERVRQSAAIYEKLGADVTLRLYRGMGHTVNAEELLAVHSILAGLVG